ncbi:hypothetical protein F5880DRAFT_1484254 [Lentinula raphanica]|nr:hypothetical protein F5880DRAFT_1484254 [Lentinula raphanica]
MADDSPNAPTTFTLTSDQLQALARAITSAQPVPASANTQVPAPPPFTSTAEPAASSKSLYALFPNIEERHILDITRHDFRPYSLHKLDRRVRSKVDTSKGGLDALALSEGSVRDYPSLDSVVVPLLTYFNILIAYARMGGNPDAGCVLSMGANTYVASLTEMAKKFQWAAVFDYHVEYMNLRRYEMKDSNYLGWGPIDGPLYALVAAHPKPVSPPSQFGFKSKPSKEPGQQPCFAWNRGECSSLPCPDNRQHVCRSCGSKDHKRGDPACKGKSASR